MSVPNTELIKDAIGHLIKLAEAGQERGCYTLDEAVDLKTAVTCFKKESSEEDTRKAVITLINAINICQKKGKLSLQEAYVAYQAIVVITQKD